jgi:hypothetical protein
VNRFYTFWLFDDTCFCEIRDFTVIEKNRILSIRLIITGRIKPHAQQYEYQGPGNNIKTAFSHDYTDKAVFMIALKYERYCTILVQESDLQQKDHFRA